MLTGLGVRGDCPWTKTNDGHPISYWFAVEDFEYLPEGASPGKINQRFSPPGRIETLSAVKGCTMLKEVVIPRGIP